LTGAATCGGTTGWLDIDFKAVIEWMVEGTYCETQAAAAAAIWLQGWT
jgi:hypothetical protein